MTDAPANISLAHYRAIRKSRTNLRNKVKRLEEKLDTANRHLANNGLIFLIEGEVYDTRNQVRP